MDDVFRALAEPHRRLLLDRLFERDGQSLGQLCEAVPDLSRFGVMKHLAVLEHAELVTTRRDGRSKLHYLNPVPIRLVHDRWISKFAEPWVRAMTGLQQDLEQGLASAASAQDATAPPADAPPRPTPTPTPDPGADRAIA